MGRHMPLQLRGEVEAFVAQITLELPFSGVTLVSLVGQERVAVGEESTTRVTHIHVWKGGWLVNSRWKYILVFRNGGV